MRRVTLMLDLLSHDAELMQVARVAKTFSLDPVALLRDRGDDFLMLVRVAAAQVVERDEKKANDETERKARSRQR